MSFDLISCNSPLYAHPSDSGGRETFNMDYSARYWVNGGCPSNRLVIGMGTYGRSFSLVSASNNGVRAPARGPGTAGTYTREAGFLAYYEICDMQRQGGATTVYDSVQQAVYTYVGDQWVGYDNTQSLSVKLNYMRQGNYGGWMTWNLDLDDFQGTHCSAGRYPLHRHLNTALSETGSSFCIGKSDGLYANPETCASYYSCVDGNGGVTPCGKFTFYNTVSKTCEYQSSLAAERKQECGLTKLRKI